MPTYDLGPLAGNTWHQYANVAGQVYYQNTSTTEITYAIPAGFQDNATDTWARDNTKEWPQWINERTGRAILHDPNPAPPQTYLDLRNVSAHLGAVIRAPDSDAQMYRRPMVGILRWLFPETAGYYVVQEKTDGDDTRPSLSVSLLSCKPGGTDDQYEFLLVESKKLGEPWRSTEEQCFRHCSDNTNDSKNVYGLVQIGLEVQFYKFENYRFSRLGDRMHLVGDVNAVISWADYLKGHPMPFV